MGMGTRMGMGEWGMGRNWEWGMGNGEWGMGNVGMGEWGIGGWDGGRQLGRPRTSNLKTKPSQDTADDLFARGGGRRPIFPHATQAESCIMHHATMHHAS